MPMLLVNREVGTQMWPSIQLPDDLGGVMELVSVAWPGYPGRRHVPGSPQISPSQHACCLLLWPVGGTWGGRNFGHQQAWRCDVGRCVTEHAHRAPAWAGVQSLRIPDCDCFHCLCEDPWFSWPHSLSCCRGVGQSTHRVNPHLFIWPFPQHCLQTRDPWPPGGSRSALLQIFTLQVAGRLTFISCN